jgi:hypothetical protein
VVCCSGGVGFATQLKSFPGVREGAVPALAFYAFVEATPAVSERELIDHISEGLGRTKILQLVALNQIDLLDSLIATDDERAKVARIVEDRRNLRDRSLPT